MTGVSLLGIAPGDLIWNLDVLCVSGGTITVDLQLNGFSDYKVNVGDSYSTLSEGDLGDLEIAVRDRV